ncbi:MAG: hypothetical protein ABI724_13580 [Betaproteobacteria bacterium]
MLLTLRTLATIASGSMLLLGASSPAQASAELFASLCSGCHNNVIHPLGLVYNAAGNAAIIETVNALGMGASGSPADHISVATYLDSIKPTITLEPVEHDSPGTVIPLYDIKVAISRDNAFLKIIESIETVTAPTKGVVRYQWGTGFEKPSFVTYTPFAGQSGTDTWTYRGIGSNGNTTIRTASVSIAAGDGTSYIVPGVWWNPNESGSGYGLDFKDGVLLVQIYSYLAGGPAQWYLAAGPVIGNTFSATLDKYVGGQCISCGYQGPTLAGNDGQVTMVFTSPTTANVTLPGGRQFQIQRYFQPPAGAPTGITPVGGVWWNPAESGSGYALDFQGGILLMQVYSYLAGGAAQWYLAAGVVSGNVLTATLDKYTGGQCISCAYRGPSIVGNDGQTTITFTSPTTANVDLPGGRHIQIERYFTP